MQAMRFTYGEHDFFIQFKYELDQKAWEESLKMNHAFPGCTGFMPLHTACIKPYNMTVCAVLMGPIGCSTKDMVLYLGGASHRSVLDKIDKNVGRKNSLKHALAQSVLYKNERDFRKAAWLAYLNRKGAAVGAAV